jgi:hypothetical protein
MCFLTPSGLRGTISQECGRSWRKEVRLPRGSMRSCFAGSRSAVAVRAEQDRVRRPPRYPRYRTGPTARHRRGRWWHEVTRTREISLSPYSLRGGAISRPEGVLGTGGARRDAGNRPPPTAGSWLQSYEFLTLEPGAISHGCGEEKPKGTEKLELLQGDGVAGAATR